LYIFFDLTRQLTVRGQTGERTALDLIYTFSFD
jgi:translocation and assembly module TamB